MNNYKEEYDYQYKRVRTNLSKIRKFCKNKDPEIKTRFKNFNYEDINSVLPHTQDLRFTAGALEKIIHYLRIEDQL